VRLAIGEVEVAVLVEVADVAERPPPLVMSDGGGLVRIVVVRERPAAGEVDQAGLTRRQFLAVRAR